MLKTLETIAGGLASLVFVLIPASAGPQDTIGSSTQHSFLATGGETYIVGEDGKVTWSYPAGTRDGCVLADGNLLLALSKSEKLPGGGAIEVTREGKVVWQYSGTQPEVNTVQAVGKGRYMLTEAGSRPRIIEVDTAGKILLEVPIAAQTRDTHLQTRMTRKLPNGNYLVPQLLDKVVREYTSQGKIAWEAKTPEIPAESWPFTAIRLENGNTLVTCTHGEMVVEFDPKGRIAWQLANSDLPEPLLKDPCGAQRLPNGNTVICAYGQSTAGAVKLLEVTAGKKLVWVWRDQKKHGIHEVHVLSTNGQPLEGAPMK